MLTNIHIIVALLVVQVASSQLTDYDKELNPSVGQHYDGFDNEIPARSTKVKSEIDLADLFQVFLAKSLNLQKLIQSKKDHTEGNNEHWMITKFRVPVEDEERTKRRTFFIGRR